LGRIITTPPYFFEKPILVEGHDVKNPPKKHPGYAPSNNTEIAPLLSQESQDITKKISYQSLNPSKKLNRL